MDQMESHWVNIIITPEGPTDEDIVESGQTSANSSSSGTVIENASPSPSSNDQLIKSTLSIICEGSNEDSSVASALTLPRGTVSSIDDEIDSDQLRCVLEQSASETSFNTAIEEPGSSEYHYTFGETDADFESADEFFGNFSLDASNTQFPLLVSETYPASPTLDTELGHDQDVHEDDSSLLRTPIVNVHNSFQPHIPGLEFYPCVPAGPFTSPPPSSSQVLEDVDQAALDDLKLHSEAIGFALDDNGTEIDSIVNLNSQTEINDQSFTLQCQHLDIANPTGEEQDFSSLTETQPNACFHPCDAEFLEPTPATIDIPLETNVDESLPLTLTVINNFPTDVISDSRESSLIDVDGASKPPGQDQSKYDEDDSLIPPVNLNISLCHLFEKLRIATSGNESFDSVHELSNSDANALDTEFGEPSPAANESSVDTNVDAGFLEASSATVESTVETYIDESFGLNSTVIHNIQTGVVSDSRDPSLIDNDHALQPAHRSSTPASKAFPTAVVAVVQESGPLSPSVSLAGISLARSSSPTVSIVEEAQASIEEGDRHIKESEKQNIQPEEAHLPASDHDHEECDVSDATYNLQEEKKLVSCVQADFIEASTIMPTAESPQSDGTAVAAAASDYSEANVHMDDVNPFQSRAKLCKTPPPCEDVRVHLDEGRENCEVVVLPSTTAAEFDTYKMPSEPIGRPTVSPSPPDTDEGGAVQQCLMESSVSEDSGIDVPQATKDLLPNVTQNSDGTSSNVANFSEAGPDVANVDRCGADEEFRSASDFFLDPNSLDFFENRESVKFAQSALARMSLYMKFDPLVPAGAGGVAALSPASRRLTMWLKQQQESAAKDAKPTFNLAAPKSSDDSFEVDGQHKLIDLESTLNVENPSNGEESTSPKANLFAAEKIGSGGSGGSIQKEVEVTSVGDDEVRQMLKIQELLFQDRQLMKDREWDERLKSLEAEKQRLCEQTQTMRESQHQMREIVAEYEKTISELISDKENNKRTMTESAVQITRERDQALEDLQNVETAFADLHRRYEKAKLTVEGLKKNEETLKECVSTLQTKLTRQIEKYELLRNCAEERLNSANVEIESMKKSNESELTALRAQLKKAEMKVESLEKSLEQKVKENSELTSICDELIARVGHNA